MLLCPLLLQNFYLLDGYRYVGVIVFHALVAYENWEGALVLNAKVVSFLVMSLAENLLHFLGLHQK